MKSMIKPLLGALVAVLALSAVASASASAEACQKKAGSKNWTLCVEGQKQTGKSSIAASIETGTSARLTVAIGEGLEIVCTKADGTAGTLGSKVSGLTIALSNCEVVSYSAQCKVKTPLETTKLEGVFGPGVENLSLAAEAGSVIFNFKLENQGKGKCPFATSIISITGSQGCTFKAAETEAATHELTCTAGQSKLLDGEKAASFSLEEGIELAGTLKGKKFSVIED